MGDGGTRHAPAQNLQGEVLIGPANTSLSLLPTSSLNVPPLITCLLVLNNVYECYADIAFLNIPENGYLKFFKLSLGQCFNQLESPGQG